MAFLLVQRPKYYILDFIFDSLIKINLVLIYLIHPITLKKVQMKKFLFNSKPLILAAGFLVMFSCVSETETPIIQEDSEALEVLALEEQTDENLRRFKGKIYFERFENSLFVVPGPGFTGGPDNAFYPGTGVGVATRLGKAMTFLNQFAQFGPNGLETVSAPVTQFFEEDLAELGITHIPDEVSSITTDSRGNSIWFSNVSNIVTAVSETRSEFTAEVAIVGGTGRFKNAYGVGRVRGFFDPTTGAGRSILIGKYIN